MTKGVRVSVTIMGAGRSRTGVGVTVTKEERVITLKEGRSGAGGRLTTKEA